MLTNKSFLYVGLARLFRAVWAADWFSTLYISLEKTILLSATKLFRRPASFSGHKLITTHQNRLGVFYTYSIYPFRDSECKSLLYLNIEKSALRKHINHSMLLLSFLEMHYKLFVHLMRSFFSAFE